MGGGGREREGKEKTKGGRDKGGDFGLRTGSPVHQEASLHTCRLKCDPTQPSATQQGLPVHTRAEV